MAVSDRGLSAGIGQVLRVVGGKGTLGRGRRDQHRLATLAVRLRDNARSGKRSERLVPLSRALLSVLLTMPCPNCGHKLERLGDWFKTVTRYECEGCHQTVRVRYEDKVQAVQ